MATPKEVDLSPEKLRKKLKEQFNNDTVKVHMNIENEYVNVSVILTNPAYYMKKLGCYHMFNLTKKEREEIQENKRLKELARLSLS